MALMTYRAKFQNEEVTEYSLDAAKGWVSARSGRLLKWVKAPDGSSYFGFAGAPPAAGQPLTGYLAEILTSDHRDF